MNYICTNDFPNPPGNPIVIADIKDEKGTVIRSQKPVVTIKVNDKEVQAHIHKGVVFSIGTASTFADLAPAEKTLVSHLMVAQKIKEATPETVKKIDAEVSADAARAARDAQAAKDLRGPTMAEIMAALPSLIATAVAAAAPKK